MTTQLQLRRDTTANIAGVTPAEGEPLYDVSRKALVLGDGATPGGLTATPFGGTWTPVLQFGGASTGIAYAAQAGWYLQIGTLVVAFFDITLASKGSAAGNATIAGLPVACVGTQAGTVAPGAYSALASAVTPAHYVPAPGSAINLGKAGGAGWSALTDADFTATARVSGSALYVAAQPVA